MATILIILACAIMANGFLRRGLGLREALVYASIPVSLFLVFITEGLSVFHALAKIPLELCWVVFAIAALLWMTKQRPDQPSSPGFWGIWQELRRSDQAILCVMCVIVGLVALTALLSAPNTWDAMEYHMPRVVEWITNRGVQLYPTIDRQQLSMPPFNEYLILHLQLLAGSDRFANLAQWLAYAGYILVVSLIAREFGADRRTQVLAAVVTATIPTGVLGASGTKNDCMLAYWIATSVLLLLKWKERQDWKLTLGIASALSLAIFSKGTAYVFLPPLIFFCFFMWNWKARKPFLLRLPVLALVCLAVSGPLWARNHAFSGSVLGLPYFDGAGPVEGRMFGNGHITPARSLANVIRNVGLHLATPSQRINTFTTNALSASIRALGVDPNDYYQLVRGQSGRFIPFNIEWRLTSEIQAGNQIHFLLFLAAGILCIWKWPTFNRNIPLFAIGIACSFVLYATLLRWAPYNARYQLPVFVLGAAFIAVVLPRALPGSAIVAIEWVLLLLAVPLALKNGTRPLLDRTPSIVTTARERTYFFDFHREYTDSFIQAANAAAGKNCHSIGIDANQMHFEYPMMALVNRDGQQRQLSYVSVHNATTSYKQPLVAEPCVVICLGCAHTAQKWQEYQKQFNAVETYGDILVFSDATMPSGANAFPQSKNSSTSTGAAVN